MADEYHTNNEYLKQIAGDESNEYHTNNEYLEMIAEQGGSGGSGVTEERVLELIAANKEPKYYNYTEDGVIQTGIKHDTFKQFIVSVQNNGDYCTYLYNYFSDLFILLNSTNTPYMEQHIDFNFDSDNLIITYTGTFDPEEGLDCTIYPLN